jgi:hypothetical protein
MIGDWWVLTNANAGANGLSCFKKHEIFVHPSDERPLRMLLFFLNLTLSAKRKEKRETIELVERTKWLPGIKYSIKTNAMAYLGLLTRLYDNRHSGF